MTMNITILPKLRATIHDLVSQFERVPTHRQLNIRQLTDFIQQGVIDHRPVHLNFICTQNSRRSHLAQIWAQTAAQYFGVDGVECFSGGNEATSFNFRAIRAMQEVGFEITMVKDGSNPVYAVKFSQTGPPIKAFSKKYDDAVNPRKDFAAIMVCSDNDANCPVITAASKKILLSFEDPKNFDGTELEAEKYRETVKQIGREILSAFSQVVRPGIEPS
jgi:arsenate reductase